LLELIRDYDYGEFDGMKIGIATDIEIINAINNLKSKNSSGYHGITNKLLKLSIQSISRPLSYIINKSLIKGVYPERLKYTIIKPKLKKGDKTLIQNYRSISIMTGFAKIFEMVIFTRLNEHLVAHKILVPQQYGFQKGLSTEDAIYSLTNTILTAWNKKEYAVGIFCDIAKAFDCVDHDLLLIKLQYYGVQGLYLQWFKSHIQHRKQKVELNNVNNKNYSSWEKNTLWDTSGFGAGTPSL
jgi:hypothetical protein